MIIYDHKQNKLIDIIEKNKNQHNIGLIFYHGVGDCVMFISSIIKLQEMYPNKIFTVLTVKGQEDIFTDKGILSIPYDSNINYKFDIIFNVIFYMTDKKITKNDYCCETELGIPHTKEIYKTKNIINTSKIIGVHFQNTCLPEATNPSEETAHSIWNCIKNLGYIPLEVHFIHPYTNDKNKKFPFIDFTTRHMDCSINNLKNVLRSCTKFIGVGSGPFLVASDLMGINNTMMLEKDQFMVEVIKTLGNTLNLYNDNNINNIKIKNFLNEK